MTKAKNILEQFEATFEEKTFENLLVEMQQHTVVIHPETAPNTNFGFFVANPQDEKELNTIMEGSNAMLSLMAVEVEGETNLFDRFSRNAEEQGVAYEMVVGDTYLDPYGYAMIKDGDGNIKCTAGPSGFVTNQRKIAVAFFYPTIQTLVFVDFSQDTIVRVSLIPKELAS